MNIAEVVFALIVAAVIIAVLLRRSRPPNPKPLQLDPATSFTPPDSPPPSSTVSEAESASRPIAPRARERSAIQDGYPVLKELLPGTPAALSGPLHAGDRILALAQGDNSFVEANSFSLADI